MRIRRRLAPSSTSTAALADIQLQRTPSDQPFVPPERPSDQITENKIVGFVTNDETKGKMEEKEFGNDYERWRAEEKNLNYEIRKIVDICDGVQGGNNKLVLQLPAVSSSSQERNGWCEEDYKTAAVPLKKRKANLEQNPVISKETRIGAKIKSKTNKLGFITIDEKGDGGVVECKRLGNTSYVIMEGGSRCSRMNGRGWRCCQPTLMGYALCEHHLGKGRRLRSMADHHSTKKKKQQHDEEKKKAKVGVVKARSMSCLLSQNI